MHKSVVKIDQLDSGYLVGTQVIDKDGATQYASHACATVADVSICLVTLDSQVKELNNAAL